MSEKIEDLLNLALEATEEERERSQELEVGFDPPGEGMGTDRKIFR